MAISWVCWLLPLVYVLVKAADPDPMDHMYPSPKGRSPMERQMMKPYWKKLYNDAVTYSRMATESLEKKLDKTLIPIKGEAVHVVIQPTVGNMYTIGLPLTEAKCPDDQEPGKKEGCEPVPEGQKMLCLVKMLVLPGTQAPFYHHEPCQDLPPSHPPADEKTEEEGVAYM